MLTYCSVSEKRRRSTPTSNAATVSLMSYGRLYVDPSTQSIRACKNELKTSSQKQMVLLPDFERYDLCHVHAEMSVAHEAHIASSTERRVALRDAVLNVDAQASLPNPSCLRVISTPFSF